MDRRSRDRRSIVAICAAGVTIAIVAAFGARSAVSDAVRGGGRPHGRNEAADAKPAAEPTASPAEGDGATADADAGGIRPAAKGASLPKLAVAPTDTIAMIEPEAATAGSTYAVRFEVYGTTAEAGTLVIHVSESDPTGGSRAFDFGDANVLARVADGTAPVSGGAYRGTLTLVDEDGLLVPTLSGIE